MVTKIIDDINKALDNNAYFAALALALTIPDICGKAEYPDASTGKRYKDWYNEYIGQYEKCPCEECQKNKQPYLSGEIVYSLRNSFLHQGTPNINNNDIKDINNRIDEFILVIEKKDDFDIYADASGITCDYVDDKCVENNRSYRVNIRRLCMLLTLTAKRYYEENKERFNFFNYHIMDWDEELKKMKSRFN